MTMRLHYMPDVVQIRRKVILFNPNLIALIKKNTMKTLKLFQKIVGYSTFEMYGFTFL